MFRFGAIQYECRSRRVLLATVKYYLSSSDVESQGRSSKGLVLDSTVIKLKVLDQSLIPIMGRVDC